MHNIAISDETYDTMTKLATDRGQSIEQLLTDLVAQERWEEHAAQAYDAYHASETGPREALTEDEFFASLHAGDADADL
jgi:hypothetical protein